MEAPRNCAYLRPCAPTPQPLSQPDCRHTCNEGSSEHRPDVIASSCFLTIFTALFSFFFARVYWVRCPTLQQSSFDCHRRFDLLTLACLSRQRPRRNMHMPACCLCFNIAMLWAPSALLGNTQTLCLFSKRERTPAPTVTLFTSTAPRQQSPIDRLSAGQEADAHWCP